MGRCIRAWPVPWALLLVTLQQAEQATDQAFWLSVLAVVQVALVRLVRLVLVDSVGELVAVRTSGRRHETRCF